MSDGEPRANLLPLADWVDLHPAATASLNGSNDLAPWPGRRLVRSATLAAALADANRRWGRSVDRELDAWLGGAEVVVTGQQPGLCGGPILTLVKACAVAAEVRRRSAAGRPAVGFLWLATSDDDLPEMGWARAVAGEDVLTAREAGWDRGSATAGRAIVGPACHELLSTLAGPNPSPLASQALALARQCYQPGERLGEATARFLTAALAGTGVILVDALEGELMRAAAPVLDEVLGDLPGEWSALEEGLSRFTARGWPAPIRLSRHKLPLFRLTGDRRESLPSEADGVCPAALRAEVAAHPDRFTPNVWLRPLVQDAALDSAVSFLGGAELAYHLASRGFRVRSGLACPEWRLRPHVTVVTGAERRLARQLRVAPERMLRAAVPPSALPGRRASRRFESLRAHFERDMTTLATAASEELPALVGDLEATAKKVDGALAWLAARLELAATRAGETDASRWRRLRAFVRPAGHPQERYLSAIAPLLRLGVEWPAALAAHLDPGHPGMHLMFWEEGWPW